jgi:RNA polymerase sigma-70 factor (ECF subfamily)
MVYADVNWIRLSALTQSEAGRLEQMMQAHGRLVFAIAYSILRHPEDAEDVVQEVFLRVMRYRYRMAFIRDERTFLSRIAQRTALDHRRRRRDTVPPEESDEPSAPGPDYAQEQQFALLAALVRTLPEELRQVLELSQVEELNSAEIGKVLGIPPGTVRSRLSRAREMLKEKWIAKTEVQRVRP